MTEVAFHTGIANPLDYACRLLRKAYRSGAKVAVHGEAALIDRLIAIVGTDPAHREAGRLRWREYERAGHAVSHLAKPAGGEG